MLYIGSFLHLTDQERQEETERRHGEFSLLVEADHLDEALQKFKDRVIDFRDSREFFEGKSIIYLAQVIEFQDLPRKEPVMLNYKSFAGDPLMPFIGCSVPSDLSDGCSVYNWVENSPEIDGEREKRFLSFDAGP